MERHYALYNGYVLAVTFAVSKTKVATYPEKRDQNRNLPKIHEIEI